MKTNSTLETIQKIQRSAQHMPEVRIIADMKIGQVVRQGDIYIERVAKIEGRGKQVASRQLAPGTSKGSRHIVAEAESVTLWESKPSLKGKAAFQVGAAIEGGGDVVVTHPEHAWIKIIGDKARRFYQVWFQSDWARKERAKD